MTCSAHRSGKLMTDRFDQYSNLYGVAPWEQSTENLSLEKSTKRQEREIGNRPGTLKSLSCRSCRQGHVTIIFSRRFLDVSNNRRSARYRKNFIPNLIIWRFNIVAFGDIVVIIAIIITTVGPGADNKNANAVSTGERGISQIYFIVFASNRSESTRR